MEDHFYRLARLGARVLISESWYYSARAPIAYFDRIKWGGSLQIKKERNCFEVGNGGSPPTARVRSANTELPVLAHPCRCHLGLEWPVCVVCRYKFQIRRINSSASTSSARASFSILSIPIFLCPRSTELTYVRSRLAFSASSSCEIPCERRKVRKFVANIRRNDD